jgi:predicted ferric reductase
LPSSERGVRARDAIGSWSLYILLAVLLVFWLFGAYGPPPPPDPKPIASSA